jgi:hypothetical protein
MNAGGNIMEIVFKGKYEIGNFELKRDIIYGKIPPKLYNEIIDTAWQSGVDAATMCAQELDTSMPSEILKLLKLKLKIEDWVEGNSKVKVFSEYEDNDLTITLHPNIIDYGVKRANESGFEQVKDYDEAKELFIAHEIYHHLECRRLGLTSKKIKIHTFKLGPIKIESGIRAMCEIAAHAFSITLYNMNQSNSVQI